MNRAAADLNHIHLLNPSDFKDWQSQKRWSTARHHFENNPTYRKLFKTEFPTDWHSLPIVQKADLQGNISDLISRPFNVKSVHIGNTSGSSGTPLYYAVDKYAHAMTYALIAHRYAKHGISLNQRQARFFGIPKHGYSRYLELAKDRVANRSRFSVFDLSDKQLDGYVARFRKERFHYVYGYTSALCQLAGYLLRKELTLKAICPSLSACIVTAEMCLSAEKEMLEHAFDLPIINEYGASEVSIIAIQDELGDWVLSEETLYVEIVDEQYHPVPDGQTGKILISALHNKAFPLIRYEIGDLGSMARKDESKLGNLEGRTNDLILLPSGRKAAGLTFYYIARSLLESGAAIKEFIIRQTALDHFVFEIAGQYPLPDAVITQLAYELENYLERGLSLEVRYVSKITRPESGKLKHFYSELSP